MPNPIQKFIDSNPVGKIFDTTITNIHEDIIFCNLDGDIDGAIHPQNLSWDADPKDEIKKYKIGDKVKVKLISYENDKIALSIREVDGNPYDEIKDMKIGSVVTCSVIETGDYGVKVKIGDNGPVTIIKNLILLSLSQNVVRQDSLAMTAVMHQLFQLIQKNTK